MPSEAELKGKWKRVGDYPPSNGQHILLKDGERTVWLAGSTSWFDLLDPNLLWYEVEVPTEVAPPPVDEKLDAEAQALFAAAAGISIVWDVTMEASKDYWRRVALKARELHPDPWRPMSELEDGHASRVLIKRTDGSVSVLSHTRRDRDAAWHRVGWMELTP